MQKFSHPNIRIAQPSDAAAILRLLNMAYRGEASKKGWTTEADLIAGEVRTTLEKLRDVMQQAGSDFLVYQHDNRLIGCVNLQQQDSGLYLGMFAVEPLQQGTGVGKALLQAAEQWCAQCATKRIFMVVIEQRKELIDWYIRNGYSATGKLIPFAEDGYSGKHLQKLQFIELEKIIG